MPNLFKQYKKRELESLAKLGKKTAEQSQGGGDVSTSAAPAPAVQQPPPPSAAPQSAQTQPKQVRIATYCVLFHLTRIKLIYYIDHYLL